MKIVIFDVSFILLTLFIMNNVKMSEKIKSGIYAFYGVLLFFTLIYGCFSPSTHMNVHPI